MKNIIVIDEDNGGKYSQLVDACKPYELTKIYLAYNLNCLVNCTYNDDVIDGLYQIYLDDKNICDVVTFANAFADWLDFAHDTTQRVNLAALNLEHFADFLRVTGV